VRDPELTLYAVESRALGPVSERRRYLVAYDISDPRRLRTVYQEMLGWGTRLQYSVYVCDLTKGELIMMRRQLLRLIDASTDSVVIIDLGVPTTRRAVVIEALGQRKELPNSGPAVY